MPRPAPDRDSTDRILEGTLVSWEGVGVGVGVAESVNCSSLVKKMGFLGPNWCGWGGSAAVALPRPVVAVAAVVLMKEENDGRIGVEGRGLTRPCPSPDENVEIESSSSSSPPGEPRPRPLPAPVDVEKQKLEDDATRLALPMVGFGNLPKLLLMAAKWRGDDQGLP